MSAKNATYQATDYLALDITVDIPAFTFATHLGGICLAGKQAAGIAEKDLKANTKAAVITAQTALLKIKEDLLKGDQIMSDDTGCGVKATSGNFVNAIALMDGSENTIIEVQPVKYDI
jgi:hypothetical protein